MFRSMSHAARWLTAAALVAAPAVSHAQADNRPVVVVFTFTNSSIGAGHADFDGIGTGVQDLLITDLASNNKIRLVDRARIGEILAEQKLAKDGAIDPATAVRLGKIMGAQYAITGGFISDGHGKAVMTGRTIDIETTQIANPTKIEGSSDAVLSLISQLSSKLTSTMNLTPKPGAPRRTGDASPAQSGSPGSDPKAATATAPGSDVEKYARTVTPSVIDKTMKVKLDVSTMRTYSSALDEMDKKNNAKASTLLKQVIAKYPDFEPAQHNLDKISGKAPAN